MQSDEKIIQVRIDRGEFVYVAESLDLPIVTQADPLEELTDHSREAIALHLKVEDLGAIGLAVSPTIIATSELDAVAQCRDRAGVASRDVFGYLFTASA